MSSSPRALPKCSNCAPLSLLLTTLTMVGGLRGEWQWSNLIKFYGLTTLPLTQLILSGLSLFYYKISFLPFFLYQDGFC